MTHCGDGHRSPEILHCSGHLAHKLDNDREPLRPPLLVPKTIVKCQARDSVTHAQRHFETIA